MTDTEPALIYGFLISLIMMAGAFGLAIDGRQEAAIVAVVTAALALFQALFTRARVTPVGKTAKGSPDKPVLGSRANVAEVAALTVPATPEAVSPGAAPL